MLQVLQLITNVTVVEVVDPIFTVGDDSRDDNLDRGVKFKYKQ